MRTIACLILLLALAPAAAAAQAASGEAVVIAQADDATGEESETPDAETDEAQPEGEGEAEPEEGAEDAPQGGRSQQPAAEEVAEDDPTEEGTILRSEDAMPEPVRETWRALRAAARSGHIERLGDVMEDQPEPPMVAFDDVGDPIAYLRSLSGDAEGREVLAILLEVLEAGFLHVDQGTPQEMYLWPYFARHPIEELTARQMVELFTLLTAGDYQDMLSYGAYIFFRVGIAPDGRWLFFLAGD